MSTNLLGLGYSSHSSGYTNFYGGSNRTQLRRTNQFYENRDEKSKTKFLSNIGISRKEITVKTEKMVFNCLWEKFEARPISLRRLHPSCSIDGENFGNELNFHSRCGSK